MEKHKTYEAIVKEIDEIIDQIELGANYRHYKNHEIYKPVKFGTLESTDDLYVIYEAQYGPGLTFIRPVREWIEQVEWDGKKVHRFTKEN